MSFYKYFQKYMSGIIVPVGFDWTSASNIFQISPYLKYVRNYQIVFALQMQKG